MAGKQLEAELKISGELDSSLRKAMANAEAHLEELSTAAKQGEGAMSALTDMISKQGRTLKAAQTQYSSYVLNGQQASAEAQELAQGIAELNADLQRNKSALSSAEQAARNLANDFDRVDSSASEASQGVKESGDSARSASGHMDLLKGAVVGVASYGFSKLVSGAMDAVRSLWDLSEQTRETRQDFATLETAYGEANFSADTASKVWSDLYAVIGEDDRAVETANNIARMANNQQDLNDWVKIATGVWGIYQDALPIENIAEAANETAHTGKVVGGLADALNWSKKASVLFADYMGGDVTNAEEAFNVALSECTSEQERQNLVTQTMLALYGDAADAYRENNKGLLSANGATGLLIQKQTELAEAIEPATTAWTLLKVQLLEAITPALTVVADKLADVIGWLQDHPSVITAVAVALGVLAVAVTAITGAVAVFTAVQMAANLSLLPVIGIGLAIAAVIALLVAGGVLLYQNWDTVKTKAVELWSNLQATWNSIKTAISTAVSATVAIVTEKWNSLKATVSAIWNSISSAISSVWNSIKSKARSFASGVVSTIRNSWNALTGILTAPFNAVFGVINSVSSAIDRLIGKASGGGSSVSNLLMGWLPEFASGGFTDGISIAGEAGTEAVLSFDPRYRADNLRYWAQAGRMLGADPSDFDLSGNTGNSSTVVNLDGVNFSPNITIAGNASKQDIIDAIREEYSEFMDLLEETIEDMIDGTYGGRKTIRI